MMNSERAPERAYVLLFMSWELRGSFGRDNRIVRPLFLNITDNWKSQRKAVFEMRRVVQPYLRFWRAWVKSEDCFLDVKEIALLNGYILNNFSVSLFKEISPKSISEIKEITKKLDNGLGDFRLWIGFGFVTTLIKMSSEYDEGSFTETLISELNIDSEIKKALGYFRAKRIKDFFDSVVEDDFKKDWIYKGILSLEDILNKNGKSIFRKNSQFVYYTDG